MEPPKEERFVPENRSGGDVMTERVSWRDLTHDDGRLLERLRSGTSLVLTHEGEVVARITPSPAERRPWVIGACGASGVGYAAAVLRGLIDAGEAVDLVVSRAAKLTILDETGVAFREADWRTSLRGWTTACGFPVDPGEGDIRCWPAGDFTAGPASGSYGTKGMVVVPATTAVLGGIAHGLSKDLVQRAAEVTLKERRPLVVVPREAPLTRAALQHLLSLDEQGAVILPASPGFYAGASDVRTLYGFIAGKVLDVLGVPNHLLRRWEGRLGQARADEAETTASERVGPPGGAFADGPFGTAGRISLCPLPSPTPPPPSPGPR